MSDDPIDSLFNLAEQADDPNVAKQAKVEPKPKVAPTPVQKPKATVETRLDSAQAPAPVSADAEGTGKAITPLPTKAPTEKPKPKPTEAPKPTVAPTAAPTPQPASVETVAPTAAPNPPRGPHIRLPEVSIRVPDLDAYAVLIGIVLCVLLFAFGVGFGYVLAAYKAPFWQHGGPLVSWLAAPAGVLFLPIIAALLFLGGQDLRREGLERAALTVYAISAVLFLLGLILPFLV